ncbi:MAG: hypothetical protein Q4F00_03605 [bacterium]|nr:hypothetical protein [bacterium]
MPNYTVPPHDLGENASPALVLTRPAMRRANRIYAHHRGATDRLVAQRSAFSASGRQNAFFTRAMQECFAYHFLHNPAYRLISLRQGVHPGDIRQYTDLSILPFLEQNSAQLNDMLPTSSNAKVQFHYLVTNAEKPSLDIPLDAHSLRRLRRAAANIGRAYRLNSREKINYLFFASSDQGQSTAWSLWEQAQLTQLTKIRNCLCLDPQSGNSLQILKQLYGEGSAWRICGSLEQLEQLLHLQPPSGIPSQAAQRSYIFIRTSLAQYRRLPRATLASSFGLPPSHVRAICTSPLQLLPFYECEAGRLHIPIYARVLVRHPQSKCLQMPGQTGQLQFLCPCLSSCAAFSLLTDYKGHLETDCPCGRRASVLIVED